MLVTLGILLAPIFVGEPQLPGALASDPRVVEAWDLALHAEDPQRRREGAALVLDRLPDAAPSERLDFLLAWGGDDPPVDLTSAWRRLARDWEPTAERVRGVLLLQPEPEPARLRGAAVGAGALGLSDPELVQRLGTLLARPEVAEAVRSALLRITGQEFGEITEFQAWWSRARAFDRTTWLSDALEAERLARLRQVARLLERDPAQAVELVTDPSSEVRRLAYEALKRVDPPEGRPADSAPARALRQAYEQETRPELRPLLVGLVTRFLQGEDAVVLLDRSLGAADVQERLRALEQLQLVRPLDLAWPRLLAALWRAYPMDGGEPAPLAIRSALWSGVNRALAADDAERTAPQLDTRQVGLVLAILEGLETDPAVRAQAYAAAGRFGGDAFARLLESHALDTHRAPGDRAAALESWIALADRRGEIEALRRVLPALLADPAAEVRLRAVRGLARLRGEGDLLLLVARLGDEESPALQAEILKVLRGPRSPKLLDALLAFTPPAAVGDEYRRTLQAQVDSDLDALERAVSTLERRGQVEGAFALVDAFPREGLDETGQDRVDRLAARTQAEWLLATGVEGSRQARAQDTLAFLQEMEQRHPDDPEWPRLQVRLALMMGRVGDALDAMDRLLGSEAVRPEDLWRLGLEVARSAAAAGIHARGWALLDALGDPPPALQEEVARVHGVRLEPEVRILGEAP